MLRSRGPAPRDSSSLPASTTPTTGTKSHRIPSGKGFRTPLLFFLPVAIILGFFYCGAKVVLDAHTLNRQLSLKLKESETKWESELANSAVQLDIVVHEKEDLQQRLLQQTQEHTEERNKAAAREEDAEKLEEQRLKRIKNLQTHLSTLQEEMQRIDRKAVLEKFGRGPHRVEIVLDFPPGAPMADDINAPTKFVIELAPLDLMPHSVHLFLEMVSHNLWDGCAFMRNAGHVIQASSVPYYKNQGSGPALRRAFEESGYQSVSFQEYHKEFPHVKYTVGFAGRPGGPDFYVSTVDNTRNHGPGGQDGYSDPTEADPCFGKVVEGFAAVDRMLKMPVKPGWYRAMEKNVGIQYARLL